MSDKQILQQAIKVATSNGWKPPFSIREVFDSWWKDNRSFHDYYKLIFDQEFAQRLWGEGYICSDCAKPLSEEHTGLGSHKHTVIAWQHHIAKMAVAENRLEYLKQFLK